MVDAKIDSLDFFEQLDEFSRRYVKNELKLDSNLSPWGNLEYRDGEPKGAILHYTADEDIHRVLRWFLDEDLKARVSAHAVIADRRLGSHGMLSQDLPLIYELPATIVQVRQYHTTAWHATWANSACYGIENVNAGPLRMIGSPVGSVPAVFASWRPRGKDGPLWRDIWKVPYKEAVRLRHRWWAPYTLNQIEANVILLRYLQQLYQTLRKPWILGHEQIQKNKIDPGPAFPLEGVRNAVCDGWTPLATYDWFNLYDVDRLWGQTEVDGVVLDWARRVGDSDRNPSIFSAWTRYRVAAQALPVVNGFGLAGKVALRLLGYHITDWTDRLDLDELASVAIFQRMMKIKVDGQPGPETKTALVSRLETQGLLEK